MDNKNNGNLEIIKTFIDEINTYCGREILFATGSSVLVSEDCILAPIRVEDALRLSLETPLSKIRTIEQIIGIHNRLINLLQENKGRLEKFQKNKLNPEE